jgi:hypothetical protein
MPVAAANRTRGAHGPSSLQRASISAGVNGTISARFGAGFLNDRFSACPEAVSVGGRGIGGLRISGQLFPHDGSLTVRGHLNGHRVALLVPTA